MSENKIRLVIDTSTLISSLFWDGNEAKLLRDIEKNRVKAYISKEIIDEIADVLIRPKFRKAISKAKLTPEEIIEKIIHIFKIVETSQVKINVCRDKKDNKFLECAQASKADYLVSGDNDLLVLREVNQIKIVSTSEILKIIR